jgi:endonuclease G, mitochondrial
MGITDREMEVQAADRYAKAKHLQANTSLEAEALILNRRRSFLAPFDRGFFESIIQNTDLMPLRYFALGQIAAAAVGRIFLQAPDGEGSGFASGFLVAPGLLLTNWHVLRSRDWARGATLTMDAEDGIDGIPKPPRVFRLEPERLFLSDQDLDFAFVAAATRAVDGTPLTRFGYLRLFGDSGKIIRNEYATIIQHPDGRQKHIAARNNKITVYPYDDDLSGKDKEENNFLYYSTDTLKGSSGSPVFSDQWFVVALHRRGVPETRKVNGKEVVIRKNGQPALDDDPDEVISYISNEGVRISRVMARLAELAETQDVERRSSARRVLDAVTQAAGSVNDGPFANPTARWELLEDRRQTVTHRGTVPVENFEITHRRIELFPDSTGYDPEFLAGHPIPLPAPSAILRPELAPRVDKPGEFLLPFRHFTTAMHARRRLPVFAAVNIDGKQIPAGAMPNRPSWSFDPRIDEAHQPDDTIFSQMLQRGHMAAREYVYWGGDAAEIAQADVHSFTLTNVSPQIQAFNAHVEWYKIERQVGAGAELEKLRITEFVGPILRSTDPSYDDLRGGGSTASFGTGIRIPLRFWKIVCWVENGALKHDAFILDQRDELEAAGPLEFAFTLPVGVTRATVQQISELTDLTFAGIEG